MIEFIKMLYRKLFPEWVAYSEQVKLRCGMQWCEQETGCQFNCPNPHVYKVTRFKKVESL